MKSIYRSLILCLAMLFSVQMVWAQGSTTASMSGVVKDQGGTELPGATVIAVHTPTNTQYVAPTNTEGRYSLQNLRVGGPYTITVKYIGYQDRELQNITLSLGETMNLNFTLASGSQNLSEVEIVSSKGDVINAERTGASTNISREQLERLPTLSRSLQDFTRLTPQASGNSLGGSNNRYNNITIDGAVNNDVFGLAGSGTPGGQAGTQPISLDAIQEIQVVLAPYDVKQGNFTGGGVNAVTRSGTNNIEGSIYGFGRNQKIVGDDPVTGDETADFKDYQTGFRIGGPIIKDKLFFFLNGEITRRNEPLLNGLGSAGSNVPADSVALLYNFLSSQYGYDAGSYGNISRRTESDKLFARLDWNINDRHQLTLRHNWVSAFDDNISRSNNTFRLGNNAYQFSNTTNSTVAELRSRLSSSLSNSLIVGYSRIRDTRETPGQLFPQVRIRYSNNGTGTVDAGTERSSGSNELDQDIFEFTNNLTFFKGNHTFTFGTHNEFFKFRNLFINNGTGYWQFANFDDFLTGQRAFQFETTYSADPNNPTPSAEFNAAQLGIYAQDEYSISERLRLTFGLRLDMPLMPDKPARNEKVETTYANYGDELRTDTTPSGQLLWAPRIGFNWDVRGDKTLQLRGGTGVFTGRVPFVWLSNQFTNNGITFNSIFLNKAPMPFFEPDPAKQSTLGTAGTTAEINLVDSDFKIPQTFRTNVAVDYTLPYGIIATLEGIYSKTLNDIVYSDINLASPTTTLPTEFDKRPVYTSKVSRDFTNTILLDNTNKGYSYNVTAQLQKNFENGITTMVAYTHGEAKDKNSGTSSTARSNWQFNQVVNNPNDPELSYSRFDVRHRVIGAGGYTVKYANNFATTVSLFYEGQSGSPFTYLYRGDLNGDGSTGNDLLYVPRTAAEINLFDIKDRAGNVTTSASDQWTALNAFIDADDYLSERRGEYAERNGARMPWTNRFDLRVAQDIFMEAAGKKHTFQITFDIFNVGNLLNKDWGHSYFVNNTAYELISYTGRNAETSAPQYTFTKPNSVWATSFSSRWQGQLGLRYIFN